MPVKPPEEVSFHQQARRQQLVDLAIELIGEGGLGAASTSAIARRAGVSRGVVNYNVGGREALMDLVVARVYRLGYDAVRPAVDAADGPRAALQAFVTASLDFYAAQPAPMRALREVFADPGLGDRASTAGHVQEVADVGDIVRSGQREGTFAEVDVALVVAVVRAALDHAATAIAGGASEESLRPQVAAVVDRVVGVAAADTA